MNLIWDLAEGWWRWMSEMSIQVTVLFTMIVVLDRLLGRRAWPQLLSALWLLIMIKLIMPPFVASPVSVAQFGVVSELSAEVLQPELASKSVLTKTAFCVWLTGFLFFSCLAVWRFRRVRQEWLVGVNVEAPSWFGTEIRRAVDRIGLSRTPRILIRCHVMGPAVFGFLRPVVVIPADLVRSKNRARIEHVLLHEMSHIRRRDPLWSFACLVVQLVYWFHPVAWIARARLSVLREIGCDQMVKGVLRESASDYRDTLLRLARSAVHRDAAGHLGFFLHPSQLVARLEWLERSFSLSSRTRKVLTAASFGVLLVSCVPLAQTKSLPEVAVEQENDQPKEFWLASTEDLQGCLQLRYAVFGMLAQ